MPETRPATPPRTEPPSGSAYFMATHQEAVESHTLVVEVDNEPGVLARVVGLFSGRGYNIESLTVSETEHAAHLSRITVVATGTRSIIDQIKAQLDRLVPVHKVVDLTESGGALERELMLIKVQGTGSARTEALQIADAFRARIVDTTTTSFVFELTGRGDKLDGFVDLMRPLGLVEVSRTGIAAIRRGAERL